MYVCVLVPALGWTPVLGAGCDLGVALDICPLEQNYRVAGEALPPLDSPNLCLLLCGLEPALMLLWFKKVRSSHFIMSIL